VVLFGMATEVDAAEIIGQYSGSESGNTAEFEVQAPWIVDWLISGDPGRYDAVNVALIDAATGAYEGLILKAKEAGNGVRLFEQGGRYYFRVDASMMDWRLKVVQLTPDEAKLYKPVNKPGQ